MPDLSKSKFHTQGYTIASTSADASATTVYTCPANFSAITRYLHISNSSTSTKKVFVQFYHADDNEYHSILGILNSEIIRFWYIEAGKRKGKMLNFSL